METYRYGSTAVPAACRSLRPAVRRQLSGKYFNRQGEYSGTVWHFPAHRLLGAAGDVFGKELPSILATDLNVEVSGASAAHCLGDKTH